MNRTTGKKEFKNGFCIVAIALGSAFYAAAALADDCEVHLGVAGPMTGGAASYGIAEKAGTEFEAAYINANGGLQVGSKKCKVSVVSFDSQSTAAGGAAASNYFASQSVHAVIGPIPSPETTGFKPVAKRHGQVNFSSSFANDVISPEFPLSFSPFQTPATWGPTVVQAVKQRFGMKSIAVVGPNDQGGTDAGKVLVKVYNDSGVKASAEWYQRGTTNFAPIVARLLGMDVEAVDTGPMPPGEAGLLAKQLLEAGFPGTIGKLGSGGNEIIKSVGGISKLKAFYYFDHVPTQDPGIQRLNEDYQRVTKAAVPENTLFYTAQLGAELLLKAISDAGTDQDGEKIAASLRKTTPESRYQGKAGWRGKSQYGINQQLTFSPAVSFVLNGKMQPQMKIDVRPE